MCCREVPCAQLLAVKPAAHLGHHIEMVARRSVTLFGQILLETSDVGRQRPRYPHMHSFAHDRSSLWLVPKRSFDRAT